MPQIHGLKEQQQALSEINQILKEIEGINAFLAVPNPTNMFELKFSVPVENTKKETVNSLDAIDASTETGENNSSKAKRAKRKKEETYSSPLYCEDIEELYKFVHLYKTKKKDHVLMLSEKYHIFLDDADKIVLGIV